jgi:hypothetical protein
MKWKDAEIKAKVGRNVIEGRLAKLASCANHPKIISERVEDYLARGGTITRLPPKNK